MSTSATVVRPAPDGRDSPPPGSVRADRRSGAPPPAGPARLAPGYLLRWVYVGRMTLASGILLGAFLTWEDAAPGHTLAVTILFLGALTATGWGLWVTHLLRRSPGGVFLYLQTVFDAIAVTVIVYVTGGVGSVFTTVYVAVLGVAGLILPSGGVAFIGALSAVLYVLAAVGGQGLDLFSLHLLLQVAVFGMISLIAGSMGARLRRTGMALGEVQSELRRLRLDTSEILSSVTSGILTVDQEGRMIYLNPAGESLLGIDARAWAGLPVLNRVEEVAPELAAHFRRSLSDGASLYRRTAQAMRDGEELVLGVATTVRDADGEPRAVTAIFQDITDQERLALLNRQNERLEAVAALSASMAHEIRNPLASIRSAVEQFANPRLGPDDRTSLARMVVRESERLSRLLSDFIDFGRVRVEQRESLDLAAVVREATAVVRQNPEAERRGVSIEVNTPPQPLRTAGDADVLHRAVVNLLLNAVQFSPDGETVEVSLRDLSGLQDHGGLGVERPLCLRVRDRGPGIPRDVVGRLFDPFFTTRREGSGLGLAMVHRAVEAHKGAIVVEHPVDGGAEFILYLPAEARMAAATEAGHG